MQALTNVGTMCTIIDIVGLIGGLLGIVAFIWRVRDQLQSYLHLALHVEYDKRGGVATALATVENKGTRRKNLDYALLLIGPESESPIKTAQEIAAVVGIDLQISSTNDVVEHLRMDEPIYTHTGRALIPLPFFYSEQVRIADETLTYKTLIDPTKMKKGEPYAVRFFIAEKRRLHRSTQDLLVL